MNVITFKYIRQLLENIENKYNLSFCWIGVKKSDYSVLPLVMSKDQEDYLKRVKLRWDDSPFGSAPVGIAIKTATPQYSNDILNDDRFLPVIDIIKQKGFKSILAIPLFDVNNKIFGVFVAYSPKQHFFTDDIIKNIRQDVESIQKQIFELFKKDIKIEERLNEYLSVLYDIITYINKGTASNIEPKHIATDILNDLDRLLNSDGSEIIIYNETDDKLEFLAASDLFLENFGKLSFDLEEFGGLSPFMRYYMNIEHAANIDYEQDPHASEWFIKKGLKSVNSTSVKAHIYNKETACVLMLMRKEKISISESELNIIKLVNQALFSAFVVRKYLMDINSLHTHLEEIATKDPLTGFYNKDMFETFLDNELNKSVLRNLSNSFSYVLIDVDNFGYINDAYGYQVGDLILKEIANILRNSVRPIDIIARIGGDEFGILMPNIKVQSAKLIMENINEKLKNEPIIINGKKIRVSLSMGISTYFNYNDEGIPYSKKEIKILAEEALRKAKHLGKSSIVIADFNDKPPDFMPVYELINKALDDDLIEPAYQPIYELSTGRVFGFEALCRIKYKDNVIYPDQFIEEAESIGLINKIDLRMMEKACKRVSIYKDFKLFVNISAKAFKDESFFKEVSEIVSSYNMQGRLFIEITERESLSSLEKFEEVSEFLKYYGVDFVIDDFGSGYSSLLYLKFIKTQLIKIDGAFVKNINVNYRDEAIVNGINFITKKLNAKTLAEFIEDEFILEKLKNMGVDYGQGYYLGKPSFDIEKYLT